MSKDISTGGTVKVIKLLIRQRQSVRERIAALNLDNTPGFEIVGEVHDALGALMAIKQRRADVVVASVCAADRGMASHLLSQFPDTTVLMLGPGGEAHIEQRCRFRWTATDRSAEAVSAALRLAVENPCALDSEVSGF